MRRLTKGRHLVALAALAAAGALGWTSLGGFSTARGENRPIVIARAHSGAYRWAPGKAVFLLALGTDSRSGNPQTGTRADSIHIIGIDPATKRASIVGIPRDSYVPIPGHGTGKINGAFAFGGPPLMIRTVESLSGCRFDYVMVTAFDGFRKMVDEFGGVPVTVPFRMNDKFARINLAPGKQTLRGADALGFARSRKTQPRGDFDRSRHQGDLMVGALEKARAEVASKPGGLLRYLATIVRHVKTDIPLFEALRLGTFATGVDPKGVTNVVLDGAGGMAGKASVVRLTSKASNTLADVCADGLLTP